MTKYPFTVIYVRGITDDAILHIIEPEGSSVVRDDIYGAPVSQWFAHNKMDMFRRGPGIYRISGYGTESPNGQWLDYHDVTIEQAKSYSFKFE
jgi:hypothetical protein